MDFAKSMLLLNNSGDKKEYIVLFIEHSVEVTLH